MFVHFPQGVKSTQCWSDFNFTSPDGERYIVTQIIQYQNKKRHFMLWAYSYEGWLLYTYLFITAPCNDLWTHLLQTCANCIV